MGRAFESRLESHVLWSTINAFNPKKLITPTNTTITHNNIAHTDAPKAKTLIKYFRSTTKHSSNPTQRIINKLTKSLSSNPIIFTEKETQALKQSKNNNFTQDPIT